jgi:predicted  nucleic acid-binding Zn-ribbon protein
LKTKIRNLSATIRSLQEREKLSDHSGYCGDATDHAFKRHLLIELRKLNRNITRLRFSLVPDLTETTAIGEKQHES